jgi:pimeloyl-ACP methyl ester carboxylesterase
VRKVVAGLAVAVMGLGVTLAGSAANAGRAATGEEGRPGTGASAPLAESATAARGVVWKRCEAPLSALECATISVPLDHRKPSGRKITLALSRKKHTVPAGAYQGILLMNAGGPGAGGLGMPKIFDGTTARKAAATYDVIGFDPRGVGVSTPRLTCGQAHGTALPESVPANAKQEKFWLVRAEDYARRCGKSFGWLLPHMRTEDTARDMDTIRQALGEKQVSYFGYSWGTYLGMTYATLFPQRVRRMVLDSVVQPSRVWYRSNLDQNRAFQKRIDDFFAWTAQHDSVYGLGTTAQAVEKKYREIRAKLKAKPLTGKIGPSELDEIFINAGYGDSIWSPLANGLAKYAGGDSAPLRFLDSVFNQDEIAAVYLATECTDAPWPKNWATWERDNRASYRVAPFMTWSNAWMNAPCAFWPAKAGPSLKISGRGLPPVLLLQSTGDAATPYPGAVEAHRLFPSSRLIVEENGGNHGISLGGNTCIDGHLSAYLAKGTVPPAKPGPDATCATVGHPEPQS